jgi:peptidyl-tRNA hydrolase
MKKIIIIAVSNFPPEFNFTKHNIAKDFLFSFIPKEDFEEYKSYFAFKTTIEETELIFIYGKTYMNTIGTILEEYDLIHTYKKDNPTTIIIHDDLEIAFGKNKFRDNKDRGERGHNGLRSYNTSLKSILKDQYKTPLYFSLGIGRPDNTTPVHVWVLQKFTDKEINDLKTIFFKESKKELDKKILSILK